MLQRRIFALVALLTALTIVASNGVALEQHSYPDDASGGAGAPTVAAGARSSPVMFIENVGQYADGARFQVRGAQRAMWLADNAIWITEFEADSSEKRLPLRPGGTRAVQDGLIANAELRNPVPETHSGVNLKLSFVNANPAPTIEPFDRLETHVSYFIGDDPQQWRPDVPVWGGVRYKDLYPGIDLELTSDTSGQPVQRMVARAGADLSAVQLRVDGADGLALDGDSLRLSTAVGDLMLPLFQAVSADDLSPLPRLAEGLQSEGSEQPSLTASGTVIAPFASSTAPASASIALVDNQADMLYGTFLGGTSDDRAYDVAVDGSGAVYVAGETWGAGFPTTTGAYDTSYNGDYDAFVTKLNASGTGLVYATFLGGASDDQALSFVVDGSGAAYVTGQTRWSGFPTTTGAYDRSPNGGYDAFVVKLNASGSALLYGTVLGGASDDWGVGIAVDSSGAAFVTGGVSSSGFPTTTAAIDTSYNGGWDAFVVKLNAGGSALDYATFLGAGGDEQGSGIAIDGSGAAYVTGQTSSTGFPTTTGACDRSHNGGYDAFVVKLNASGAALAYGTFLGGTSDDWGNGVAVDSRGAAYVAGATYSAGFPTTTGAYDVSHNGDRDVYVAKLNAAGSALVYSTLLGGTGDDFAKAVASDGSGAAYVTGHTVSAGFPTTAGALDRSHNGNYDVYVAKLNAAGSELAYSSFLGGTGDDWGNSVAIGSGGGAYVAGHTASATFLTSAGAYDRSYNGGVGDAFAALLALGGGTIPDPDDALLGWARTAPMQPTRDSDQQFVSPQVAGDPLADYRGGAFTAHVPVARYYGPVDANKHILPSYVGTDGTVAATAILTIKAWDVDSTRGELDTIAVNDTTLNARLEGSDGQWSERSYDIPVDVLHFPRLGDAVFGVAPEDNIITIDVDALGQGWKSTIAWVKLEIPGTRPVLFLHGSSGRYWGDDDTLSGTYKTMPFPILARDGYEYWQKWLNPTDGLLRGRVPNLPWPADRESDTQDPGEAGQIHQAAKCYATSCQKGNWTEVNNYDTLAPTYDNIPIAGDTFVSDQNNQEILRRKIDELTKKYGVDKVNLVGHSRGSLDVWIYTSSAATRENSKVDAAVMLSGNLEGACLSEHPKVNSMYKDILANATGRDLAWKQAYFGFMLNVGQMVTFNKAQRAGDSVQYWAIGATGGIPDWHVLEWLYLGGWACRLPNDGGIDIYTAHLSRAYYEAHRELPVGASRVYIDSDVPAAVYGFNQLPDLKSSHDGMMDDQALEEPLSAILTSPLTSAPQHDVGPLPVGTGEGMSRPALLAPSSAPSYQIVSAAGGTIGSGETQTQTLPVDGSEASIMIRWLSGDMGLYLLDPNGFQIDPSHVPPTVTYTVLTTDTLVAAYTVSSAASGLWTAVITASAAYTEDQPYELSAVVSSTLGTIAQASPGLHYPAEPLTLTVAVADNTILVPGGWVAGTMLQPDGTDAALTYYDDGTHGDQGGADGVYTTLITPTRAGFYLATITARGDYSGTPYQRQDGFSFQVITGTARLSTPYGAGVRDTDADGLYNTLTITSGVTVTQAGVFYLTGSIWDTNGSLVTDAAGPTKTLAVGAGSLTLPIDGSQISKAGLDGPYVVTALRLVDVRGGAPTLVDERKNVITTTAYLANQFEHDDLRLLGTIIDQGIDTNGDGLFDLLRISVPVDAVYSGTYRINAALAGISGTLITVIGQDRDLSRGSNSVALDFSGIDIVTRGLNGPYQLQTLDLSKITTPTVGLSLRNVYTSAAYTAVQFMADTQAPATTLQAVAQTMETSVLVTWSAADPAPSSGIAAYDLQFRDGTGGSWQDWIAGTPRLGATFGPTQPVAVAAGHSYYLRSRASDLAGNTGLYGSDEFSVTILFSPPVADFDATPRSGAGPLSVQFSDQSTGAITSRLWSFGDGENSGEINPQHVYTPTGVFTVALAVSGPGGMNTLTRTNYITVTPPPPPLAAFDATPLTGTVPLTVQFSDHSTGTITSRLWSFGDGLTSAQTSPQHTYQSVGIYTVGLQVGGPGGTDAVTRTNYISVTAAPPIADFDAAPRSGAGPLSVQFTQTCTGSVSSYLWTFGDGMTSTLADPLHRYMTSGNFTASLAVNGPGGSDALTRTNYITVTPIYEQRVRVGGGAYTDRNGNVWAADQPFTRTWGYVGGAVAGTTALIANTDDDPLYRKERSWTASATPGYRFAVPNGQYRVTLLFSENTYSASGLRKFNVRAEGARVLTGFDIFAAAGGMNRAVTVTLPLTSTINVVDGELTLDFMKVVGNPKVDAIDVRWVGPYENRINAGGATVVAGGATWAADRAYSAGAWGYVNPVTPSVKLTTTQAISNTEEDKLYQDARAGMSAYKVALPNGVYSVTLKFAELQYNRTGRRQFSVKLENVAVLVDLDIFALAPGKSTAYDRSFTTTVSDGMLNIAFSAKPGFGLPLLSAIEVRQQ